MATVDSVKTSLTQTYNTLINKLIEIRKRLSDMGVAVNNSTILSTLNTDILSIENDVETPKEQNCKVWIRSELLQNFVVNDIAYGNGKFIAVGYIDTNGYIAYSYDGLSWTLGSTSTPFIFKSVCYGNGMFIAIPTNMDTQVVTSTDGMIWQTQFTRLNQVHNKIIYANNLFVIIGKTSIFLTSTDGIVWEQRSVSLTGNWVSIAFNPGKFIAIQSNSINAAYSIDGITWITITLPSSGSWTEIASDNHTVFYIVGSLTSSLRSNNNGVSWDVTTEIFSKITYGNNVFIASDNTGTSRYCSYNLGLSWILRSTASTQGLLSTLKYTYGKFFMFSISESYIYSSDAIIPVIKENVGYGKLLLNGYSNELEQGISMYPQPGEGWELRNIPQNNNWTSCAYGNGIFVVVSYNTYNIMTSADGITWTLRASEVSSKWQSITFGNGMFVAVSQTSTNIITSPDGITWTLRTAPVSATWNSVTYGNGMFVSMSYGTNNAMTSPDGIIWTLRTLPVSGNWYSVTFGNGMFVTIAQTSTNIITSPDGITWTLRTAPVSATWNSVTYGNGMFVAVSNSAIIITSPNGINWTQRVAPISSTWQSIAYGNGLFVAFAYNTSNIMTSTDGINWKLRTAPVSGNWNGLCYANGLFVVLIYGGSVYTSGKMNSGTPNVIYGSFIPTSATKSIICKFKPDKVYIVARGINIDKKRFCKINISNPEKFRINNVECSTYTIYNNSGTSGLYVTDISNTINQEGFSCTIPTAELYDGTVIFDYYAIGSKE